jgi:hypothetical protein
MSERVYCTSPRSPFTSPRSPFLDSSVAVFIYPLYCSRPFTLALGEGETHFLKDGLTGGRRLRRRRCAEGRGRGRGGDAGAGAGRGGGAGTQAIAGSQD